MIDYGSAVISPGVIDVHVHMNEPGREDWEGRCAGPLSWVQNGCWHACMLVWLDSGFAVFLLAAVPVGC